MFYDKPVYRVNLIFTNFMRVFQNLNYSCAYALVLYRRFTPMLLADKLSSVHLLTGTIASCHLWIPYVKIGSPSGTFWKQKH